MSRVRLNDHAFARYCERVLDIDRAAIEKALSDTLNPLKDGRHKLPGGDILTIVYRGEIRTFVPFSTPPHTSKGKPKRRSLASRTVDRGWLNTKADMLMAVASAEPELF